MDIASTSETLPIFPASGIIIFVPKVALVDVIDNSSIPPIFILTPRSAWRFKYPSASELICIASSLNCICIPSFNNKPLSWTWVIVVSLSRPKLIDEPSVFRNKFDISNGSYVGGVVVKKSPKTVLIAVVVANINLPDCSFQPIKALGPVDPLSISIPQSLEFDPVKPEFNSIILSDIVVFVEDIIEDTFKSPCIVTEADITSYVSVANGVLSTLQSVSIVATLSTPPT